MHNSAGLREPARCRHAASRSGCAGCDAGSEATARPTKEGQSIPPVLAVAPPAETLPLAPSAHPRAVVKLT